MGPTEPDFAYGDKQQPPNTKGGSRDTKGRGFFQQMQPTFSVAPSQSNIISLEFLDHSDPHKDTVVRKKAREWVNKTKEQSKHGRESQAPSVRRPRKKDVKKNAEDEQQIVIKRAFSTAPKSIGTPYMDPFGVFPQVDRNIAHILEFFFTVCIEEVPCSDDKYSKDLTRPGRFVHENTVLGNMIKHDASFKLWLYATTTIRDEMFGNRGSEENQHYYREALVALQDLVKEESKTGIYSDNLVHCLACITATACTCAMFEAAALHRDALVRVLEVRGNGSIAKGLRISGAWTQKCAQWCELMVAIYEGTAPQIPYIPQKATAPIPEQISKKALQHSTLALSVIPHKSERFRRIFYLMHLLAIAYAQPHTQMDLDAYIIGPFYDAQYGLLLLLDVKNQSTIGLTNVEKLLLETFELYLWMAMRRMPPQTKLGKLLILRTINALLPLVMNFEPAGSTDDIPIENLTLELRADVVLEDISQRKSRKFHQSRGILYAIAWCLALGEVITAPFNMPEHKWYLDNLTLYFDELGFANDESEFHRFLDIFPETRAFPWLDISKLYTRIKLEEHSPSGTK